MQYVMHKNKGDFYMKKILFVCTGNTCRSPMAEGIFNKLAAEQGYEAVAKSAGLFVTEPNVSENSLEVCKENGIDISGHTPMPITAELINEADVILTMTSSHKAAFGGLDKVYTAAEYFGSEGDIIDPYGGSIEIYRQTFCQLEKLIGSYYEN